ncbi:MAG TPA: amino acid ABC transporter permease [Xanthobacteraceae bacterium]|nr:amino acid ABC transporter permease [Xanthobacteraceae bacterium]
MRGFARSVRDRRAIALQAILVFCIAALVWFFLENARSNVAAQNTKTGFDFFWNTAGFGVVQALIPYDETSTYFRAFLVGLANTLLVSALGIVFATVIGFLVGIGRLSSNWLVARLCGGYVELLRNLPLLFQILFWYLAVLASLPAPRNSFSLLGVYVNNRGLILPRPVFGDGAEWVLTAFVGGVVLALLFRAHARRRQAETGEMLPTGRLALGAVVGLPLVVFLLAGAPISFEVPELRGFNFVGGLRLIPEFVALLIALSTYTAAFIAEIVRAGILAVPRGQSEAAYSLGLRRGLALRLIVLPQALRVIIPPLTSQYLNLTKNSSLAVAIGYPDFFALFAGTTLNQTGQATEIIAITMLVYLAISLTTSAAMNWYNRAHAWVER